MILSRRRKRLVLGFLAVGIVVGTILVGSARYLEGQRERQRFEQEREELRPPEPVAHVVGRRELVRERRYTADVVPWVEAEVPAEVAGVVIETAVEPGQEVKKGDVLVVLDSVRARIAADLAKARHDEAMRLLGEAERLQKSRVVSKTAYEAAMSEARVTKAQLDDAQDFLARHSVTAPFDGIVNARLVDVGDAVNVNQPVVDLVDLQRLRVIVYAAEADLEAFEPGSQMRMRLQSDGRELSPVIRHVARSAHPETRLFRIEGELDNAGGELPGRLQGIVKAEIAHYPEMPVVPAAAVRFAGHSGYVLKDTGGDSPERISIEVGPEVDGYLPVFEGLEVGDRIFIR
jgi:membrane fusion protein, multidrug efflux system